MAGVDLNSKCSTKILEDIKSIMKEDIRKRKKRDKIKLLLKQNGLSKQNGQLALRCNTADGVNDKPVLLKY